MPQLDQVSFFLQSSLITCFFLFFYFFAKWSVIPHMISSLKLRRYIIDDLLYRKYLQKVDLESLSFYSYHFYFINLKYLSILTNFLFFKIENIFLKNILLLCEMFNNNQSTVFLYKKFFFFKNLYFVKRFYVL